MTLEDFNNKEFDAGQTVIVTFNDGTTRVITLAQGNAYPGHDAQEAYLGGPGRKASPPKIVIYNPERPQGDGISLNDVEDVTAID